MDVAKDLQNFERCANCGRYFPPRIEQDRPFCSDACAVVFVRCAMCGRYFETGTGIDDTVCSRECSIAYQLDKPGSLPDYSGLKEESA